jgi:hypothetical protein
MGRLEKLVNTEQNIEPFRKRYGIPEDVQIRYASSDDLALLEYRDLVLPIIAIVEGGVRIPMHPFLIQFLTHFRLGPLQCVPNVFRIVMGTAVLMEKLGLELTVHDITYVYRLQKTGKDQYTLVARHWERKLVTGLPDSSKGRDEDFLVFTGNWQNPHFHCTLAPGIPGLHCSIKLFFSFCFFCVLTFALSSPFSDKDFTAINLSLVERRTVEHLLQKPCFIDSAGRPRSASFLLGYVPTYQSFQKGPTVKDRRQTEVTVSRPGIEQEDIIQAVPLTRKKGVQIPHLVNPLFDSNFVPSTQPSGVGLPVIHFPSLFDPNPQTRDDMPVQRRSIDIGSKLGTSVPQSSETSSFPPPLGFSQGEEVRGKRKKGEQQDDEVGEQEVLPLTEPSKTKPSLKKGKGKTARALQKAAGLVPHKKKHRNNDPKVEWSCAFSLDGWPVDEDDSVIKGNEARARGGQVADAIGKALLLPRDMKVWQSASSERMVENLKCDAVLVSF